MRALVLTALLVLPAAVAHADPVEEARSATGACFAAILDGAPVETIQGEDVAIYRKPGERTCTVSVWAGEPVVIREAVLVAVKRRAEAFSPARTAWDPGQFASREVFCNLPSRRAVIALIDTHKPGGGDIVTVTVADIGKRDDRCDRDLGLQKATTEGAAAPPPSEIIELAPRTAKPKKKRDWIPSFPKIGKES
ncbi:hypothetical protein [uncultured Phenylobacterium sp.]|uniref:hypothetical protein n=1 Tax=uncultured Phenylobacterium sp. TaxID=349273 RepID=UPI0025DC5E8E|nr:hypothetical protein [uncultured Phenylobacterium sp.]